MPSVKARPCAVAGALAVIGEKWSLLVVREIAFGVFRFDRIARNTGAPRDILTTRLRTLEAAGVIEKRRYSEHPPRYEYHLTLAGDELRPILLAIGAWGSRWLGESPPVTFTHSCGDHLDIAFHCRACGGGVTGGDVTPRYNVPGWTAAGPDE